MESKAKGGRSASVASLPPFLGTELFVWNGCSPGARPATRASVGVSLIVGIARYRPPWRNLSRVPPKSTRSPIGLGSNVEQHEERV